MGRISLPRSHQSARLLSARRATLPSIKGTTPLVWPRGATNTAGASSPTAPKNRALPIGGLGTGGKERSQGWVPKGFCRA